MVNRLLELALHQFALLARRGRALIHRLLCRGAQSLSRLCAGHHMLFAWSSVKNWDAHRQATPARSWARLDRCEGMSRWRWLLFAVMARFDLGEDVFLGISNAKTIQYDMTFDRFSQSATATAVSARRPPSIVRLHNRHKTRFSPPSHAPRRLRSGKWHCRPSPVRQEPAAWRPGRRIASSRGRLRQCPVRLRRF